MIYLDFFVMGRLQSPPLAARQNQGVEYSNCLLRHPEEMLPTMRTRRADGGEEPGTAPHMHVNAELLCGVCATRVLICATVWCAGEAAKHCWREWPTMALMARTGASLCDDSTRCSERAASSRSLGAGADPTTARPGAGREVSSLMGVASRRRDLDGGSGSFC
ncbi:hypothetical protein L226DRAFT_104795 [Lentinus tigrinus ALCF2SS1-7]|uniref:uncharacterized protein n=1 Tax=Lentinus tigrinus ALCF2SS1-7 TaxID=1328758 RepID=UPI001165E868|nr:hypothetical protein L226DRAFT_104795 [Lentinus tigrinus ALCF2SS1-7]